jgi:hypothetical protein
MLAVFNGYDRTLMKTTIDMDTIYWNSGENPRKKKRKVPQP